jgi:hypothetical protein
MKARSRIHASAVALSVICCSIRVWCNPVDARADPVRGSGLCPVTAANSLDWGAPVRSDPFSDPSSLTTWQVYDSVGHGGNGRRTPAALSVADGLLTITGDADGNSGGMAWRPGQLYGRWEVCAKSPPASPNYHSVLLLWPDSENWPSDGEIDFMEILDPARQDVTASVLKFDPRDPTLGGLNFHANVAIDATQWHSWAVQWNPDGIVGYVDGMPWFETTANIPTTPMHLAVQLDDFGGDISEGGRLQVDWARQYA